MKLLSILSPIVQKPTVQHPSLSHHIWCSTPSSEDIWSVLHHPEIYPLIIKACNKILSHYQIHDERHDIIIDAILNRIRNIQKHNGLTFPSQWKPGFSWKAWLYTVFHNITRTLAKKHNAQRVQHSLEDLQESHTLLQYLADDKRFSPEDATLYQEQQAYIKPLQILDYILKSQRISPPKRLYYLLLHHPQKVVFAHFEEAHTSLNHDVHPSHRPLMECWGLWLQHQSTFHHLREQDNAVGTAARDWITWLIFGKNFQSHLSFVHTDAFRTAKERIRRAINRCHYESCTALLIHVLLHHNLHAAPDIYRPFIAQKLVQSNLLKRAQLAQKEAFSKALFDWGLHKENQSTLSLMLFSSKGTPSARCNDKDKAKTTLRRLHKIACDIGEIYPQNDPLYL